MNLENFSKGVLLYAVENNISKKDLLKNYKTLISDYYEFLLPDIYGYREEIMTTGETSDYVLKYRAEFFECDEKSIFWLIMDDYFTNGDDTDDGELSDNKIVDELTAESTGKDVYWFLKNKLKDYDDSFFKEKRDENWSGRHPSSFSGYGFFKDILTEVGVPDDLHEYIAKEAFRVFPQFTYAHEDWEDEYS